MLTFILLFIIAGMVGEAIGGAFAITSRVIHYFTHRKEIKKEKELNKKEEDLYQWQREQWVKEMEEKKKAQEAETEWGKQKKDND